MWRQIRELRREYFQTSQFAVGQDSGKALMSLSSDWLLSFPQTLRRGDKVSIYNGTVKLMEAVTAHVKDSGGQEVLSQDSQRMEAGRLRTTNIHCRDWCADYLYGQ